jgi:hypothetical protein
MVVTESEIKQIIEGYVREYLTELKGSNNQSWGDTGESNPISNKVVPDQKIRSDMKDRNHEETVSDEELRKALSVPGLNMAAVANMVPRFQKMTKDTRRSYLSKIRRGILKADDELKSQIMRAIKRIAGKLA